MLVDDFVMRQVQKIAEMLAAIAGSPHARPPEGVLDQIRQAYRDLLGMDVDLADLLGADALVAGLRSERERDALVDLTLAHAEVCARRDDAAGARARLTRALALMREDDLRVAGALARLDDIAASR